jgi:hypothetical protein
MMDRLKARPEEKGSSRIVTREVIDGQSVEVVRRRKRRTHQPKKEKEKRLTRMKRLALFVGLPIVLLVVALVVTTLFRYQSESFRAALSDRVSEMLGFRTEIRRLQVKGVIAATTNILVTGEEGGLLKEAEFGTIKGNFATSSFFSSNWILNNLEIQSGNFLLHAPKGSATAFSPPSHQPEMLMAGLGLSPKPKGIELGLFRITSCDVTWDPEEEEESVPQLIIDSALVSTSNFGPDALLSVRGGQLLLPGWPAMDIEKGEVAMNPGGAEIRAMSLNRKNFGDSQGSARMSGRIGLEAASPSAVTVELKSMELRGLVPEFWISHVRGAVSANLEFRSALGEPGSLQAEGDFSVANAVIGALSSLKQLATYAGEARLTRLEFDTLSGHYRKTALGVEVTELKGEMIGFFRVRGGYAITSKGAISGTLEIGLPEALFNRRTNGKPAFFGPAEDGYCWATTNLKGRNNEPEDDLNPRFEQEAAQRKLRTGEVQLRPATGPPSPLPTANGPAAPAAAAEREKLLEDTFDSLIGE